MSGGKSVVVGNRPEVNLRTGGAGSLPSVVARPLATATPGLAITAQSTETDALLRSLDIGIGRFSEAGKQMLTEDREEQFKKGQLAQEQNQKDFSKAVEDGVIPQTANPWFIKGYQNQDGRVAGNNYYTEMRAAYANSEAKGSDDPKVYEKFVQGFTKSYMEKLGADKSAEWMAGFQTVSDGARRTLASEHASQAEAAVIAKNEANTGAEINVVLNGTKDPQQAAEAINALGEKMRLMGMPRASFEKVAAEAILAKAKLGDPGMLKALDYVKTGDNGATLASNPKVVSARVDTENWLTEKRRGDQRWAWAVEDRQWNLQQREWAKQSHAREEERYKQQQAEFGRHEKARSLMTIIQTSAMADPAGAYANNREALTELSKVDPAAASSTASFLDAFTTKRERVDDATERPIIAQLQRDMILAAGNPQAQQQLLLEANRLFTSQKLNKETMMKFIDDSQRFASWDPSTQRKLQSDGIKRVERAVEQFFASDPLKGATGAVALDVLYVNQAIQRKLIDALKANPNLTDEQLVEQATGVLRSQMQALGATNQFSGKAEALGAKVGPAVRQTTPGGPPQQTLPTTPEAALPLIAPAEQGEFVRKVQEEMQRGGMPAMLKALADFDNKIGIPGIGRLIIERNSQPPAPSKKK